MKVNSLQELYVDELKDLYDAENQIIKALPKMIDAASSEELQNALTEHLEVTREQAKRIEQIFQNMGEKLKAEKCKGMEGVIKEGAEILSEDMDENVKDAAIISAAQRVEHYEMAGYGTVRTWANLLGESEAEELLQETLDEEKEADEKLNQLAEQINVQAEAGADEEEEPEVRPSSQQRRPKKSSSRSRRAA
ncbi:MAG: ferritin-like domain-containing protein [Acidobacteriota bacterium]|nr:ferritin-like domain-containing protein [Terriglobales bacterium]